MATWEKSRLLPLSIPVVVIQWFAGVIETGWTWSTWHIIAKSGGIQCTLITSVVKPMQRIQAAD